MIFIHSHHHYRNDSFSINYNIASDIKQDKRLVELSHIQRKDYEQSKVG